MLSVQLQKIARDLIDSYGDTITIINRVVGAPDISTGLQATTDTEVIIKGVYEDDIAEDIDGYYTIASLDDVSLFSYIRKLDGKELRIVSIEQVGFQDNVIIYKVSVTSDNDKRVD